MRILRTSSWGDRISSNSERTDLRRRGEEPHYIKVLKQKAGSLNIKRLLLIKKTTRDISWNLKFFYVWEDARIRVHWTHSFHIVFVLVCPTLCNPMDAACQASLSFTISWTCSNSCPLSRWYHLTITSSVIPFSSCPQSFPASESFPMNWVFSSESALLNR